MSCSCVRTLPGYVCSTCVDRVARRVPDGRPVGWISATCRPLLASQDDGAEDGRGDVGVGEGDVVGRRRDRAGRPAAARSGRRHQRDAERVGGADRVVAQPGGGRRGGSRRRGRRRRPARRGRSCRWSRAVPLRPRCVRTKYLGAEHARPPRRRRRRRRACTASASFLMPRRHLEQQADAGGVVRVPLARPPRSRSGRRRRGACAESPSLRAMTLAEWMRRPPERPR